jgi:hypothetical protein
VPECVAPQNVAKSRVPDEIGCIVDGGEGAERFGVRIENALAIHAQRGDARTAAIRHSAMRHSAMWGGGEHAEFRAGDGPDSVGCIDQQQTPEPVGGRSADGRSHATGALPQVGRRLRSLGRREFGDEQAQGTHAACQFGTTNEIDEPE